MKRAGCLFMAMMLTVLAISGCSNSSSGESGQESQKSNDDSSGGEVMKIMSVGTETDQYTATMRELAKEFSENNEYGVTVEFELYENEQYKTKMTTLMASNAVTDIFFTWELGYLEPFVSSGKVMSLQDALDADPEWRDSFLEGVLDYFTYDGEVYAIPSQIAYCTMFYNQDIFEQYDLEVPQTYEDFLNICETLKAAGVTPMTLAGSEAWIPAQFISQLALGIGGDKTYENIMNGTEAWNNNAYKQAAEEAQKMVEKGWFTDGMLAMTYDEAIMKLNNGEAAMYFMASWDASGFVVDSCPIKDSIGTFNMPAMNPEYNHLVVGSADTAYAISKNCSNPEAAVAFLKYITSKDWQERDLIRNAKMPTVIFDIDESQLTPLVSDIVNNLKDAQVFPWWDRVFGSGEGESFNNACLAVFGGEDVDTAFGELQVQIEANAQR